MNPQTNTAPQEQPEAPASFAAILPLLLFLLIFIGTGVSLSPVSYTHLDVYKRQR